MKNSLIAVIVGAMLVGCGGADTAGTKSLASGQALKAAAPTGATGSTTCNTGDEWWNGPNPITTNLVVPAGAICRMSGVVVQGNTSVNGSLYTIGSTFDGNVSVDGGCLTTANQGNTFKKNLSITNSPGCWLGGAVQDGFWTPYSDTIICGNFSYSYDLTYSGTMYPFYIQNCDDQGNCHNVIVGGSFNVSNASANGNVPVMVSGASLPASCTN
jgi:hypothetical protein